MSGPVRPQRGHRQLKLDQGSVQERAAVGVRQESRAAQLGGARLQRGGLEPERRGFVLGGDDASSVAGSRRVIGVGRLLVL